MSKLIGSKPCEPGDEELPGLFAPGSLDACIPHSSPPARMVRLTRETRFLVDPANRWTQDSLPGNSWAGWPTSDVLALYLVLRATIAGVLDARTGFLWDVQILDKLLRQTSVQTACDLSRDGGSLFTGERLLSITYDEVAARLPTHLRLDQLELLATPQLRYRINQRHSGVGLMLSVTQQFEFSAAHRLHCNDLSDEENRRLFGKCNGPNGHGHNYVIEVTLEGEANGNPGALLPVNVFEQIVKRVVIDRFDHQHLNLDLAEFRELNPTVENIAQVIFGLLEGKFAPARLGTVRVYETPKTWAEVRGEPA